MRIVLAVSMRLSPGHHHPVFYWRTQWGPPFCYFKRNIHLRQLSDSSLSKISHHLQYLAILTQLNNVSSSVNHHPRAAQRPTHATSSRRSSGSSSPKPHLRSASSPPCASSPSSNRCCDPAFLPHTKLHTGKDALPLKHTRSRLPSPRRGVKQIEAVVKHPPPRPPCTRSEAERRENVGKRTSTSFWTLAGVAGVSLHPSFFASGHIYGG
jgi:hypothetical protein